VPDFYVTFPRARGQISDDSIKLNMRPFVKNPIGKGLPRCLESAVAFAGIVLIGPMLLLIALVVALTSRGPILFRHRRIGKGGRHFEMLKFRTMCVNGSGPGITRQGDTRITPVGRFLRKTKLDELPELWNVVRGDMSLVGPRPEAVQYVQLADSLWQEVLSVRPGITDPTTLHLRNEEGLLAAAGADYETFYRQTLLPYKLHGYREYLGTRTWKSDVSVLWLTLLCVILPSRKPAPSPGEVPSSHRSA
jgi:lipopolysaccharide/colanic/teichoic acid biosynthesis glycosyltransferase